MAQFSKGETFADGQQVTGARLNQLVDAAVLTTGAITEQTNITANTVASGDSILLYDLSATALREANVSDVLGSNLPVTTSAVTAGANSDIVVTPNDGTIVTGQAYTSADGLTVTVTSTAHGLVVGQVILVTAAATGYNGTFRVATIATNSFTYVMTTAATAGSATLSYTKKGAVRNAGNESIAGSLFVAGNAVVSGSTVLSGATAMTGATTVSGATAISGATTVSGAFTSSGTANFTGALQVKGTNTLQLYDVSYTPLTFTGFSWGAATAFSGQWYLTTGYDCLVETITVPAGERWVIKYDSTVNIDSNNTWNLVWMVNGVSIPFFNGNVSSSSPVIFTSGIAPARYTYTQNNAVAILEAGTNVVKNKGAGYGGGGGIQFIGTGNGKTVYKYKIA